MADRRHVNILKRGTANWNRWRGKNTDVKPDLSGADLGEADLSGANLIRVNLIGVNFTGADLRAADVSHAGLMRANFTDTNLSGVNFSSTWLSETVFGDSNLTDAVGLETCVHMGPSILDHRTFLKSGQLPLAFLRGCGLPDTLIEYLPSLLNQPIQFYSCFISYSHHDKDFARRLHDALQGKG